MEGNFYYELGQAQLALDAAHRVIRSQKCKLFGKNLLILGSLGLFLSACKMLDDSEKKRKAAENEARGVKAELAHMQQSYDQLFEETQHPQETDICCDGHASVTKKNV